LRRGFTLIDAMVTRCAPLSAMPFMRRLILRLFILLMPPRRLHYFRRLRDARRHTITPFAPRLRRCDARKICAEASVAPDG